MKIKLILFTAILFMRSFEYSFSQQLESDTYLGNGIFSIDVPSDPQSVAMAESFVAFQKNRSAMLYNPAGLAGVNRISILYSQRAMNWITGLDDMKYQAVTASIPTSLMNIGLLYNRFTQGEDRVRTAQNPEGDGTTVSIYDHTIGIGLAKQYNEYLGFGLSIKTFNSILKYNGPSSQNLGFSIETTALPILFDFGILYSNILSTEQENYQHQLNIGLSVQNVGTALKQKQLFRTLPSNSISSQDYSVTLPQYLRFGFTYEFGLHGRTPEALAPLNVLVTAEYKNSLNGVASRKDYWGFGLELKLYEIASVRMGTFINPHSSIYGNEGTPALRYGFGLSAPLEKIGAVIPLTLNLDYAAIPLQKVMYVSSKVNVLHTFSIGLQYENELF